MLESSPHSEAADADEKKSVREVTTTEYTGDNGVKKTILWVDHITLPVMNGSDDANADFKKIETEQGGHRYIEYAPLVDGSMETILNLYVQSRQEKPNQIIFSKEIWSRTEISMME